jgi:hypothetical protein
MEALGPGERGSRLSAWGPERALRWCVTRTVRDYRLSVAHQRPITLPNALRLFRRRWARVSQSFGSCRLGLDLTRLEQDGIDSLRMTYFGHGP